MQQVINWSAIAGAQRLFYGKNVVEHANTLFSRKGKRLLLAASFMVITACDSSGTNEGLIISDQPSADSPDINAILNVPELIRVAAASPASKQGNLLVNGSFENDLTGWGACNDINSLSLSGQASDGQYSAVVKKGDCIQQGLTINPGDKLTLSCDAKIIANRSDWSGLGFSFYDSNWNFVSEPDASIVSGNTFKRYTVSGVAPQDARNLGVWFYTENKAAIDNCILTLDSPPEPPEPPPTGNLLSNASFIEQNGNMPGDWTDLCNGTARSNFAFNDKSLTVADGACVHQYLSSAVLQALQGNDFVYSCKYSSSTDDYATIATNLTSTRDNTGQNDVVVLPRTDYFGRVPVIKTARLFGRAKDTLEPNDIFVSISGDGNLFVTECALEIDTTEKQNYTRTITLQSSTSLPGINGTAVDGGWGGSYRSNSDDAILLEGTAPSDARNIPRFYIKRRLNSLFLYVNAWAPPTSFDSFPENGQLWNDDSFEIYFNLGNEPTNGYDDNDYVKIFGWNAGSLYSPGQPVQIDPVTVTGANSRKELTHFARCVLLDEFGNGTRECEIEFDLAEMGLANLINAEFGFDIHFNIDEDGGNRDSKWSWCSGDTITAWEDMSKVTCSFILDETLVN